MMQITYDRVKELFGYKNGQLIWRVSKGRARGGNIAGTTCPIHGYTIVQVDNKQYKSHRLIWLWHNGYFPENNLDHIDQNRANNKIENLREASSS